MPNWPERNVDPGIVNSLVRRRIQDAIATQLPAKRYLEIIEGASDFYVTYIMFGHAIKSKFSPCPVP
jgi:hypothetical protein